MTDPVWWLIMAAAAVVLGSRRGRLQSSPGSDGEHSLVNQEDLAHDESDDQVSRPCRPTPRPARAPGTSRGTTVGTNATRYAARRSGSPGLRLLHHGSSERTTVGHLVVVATRSDPNTPAAPAPRPYGRHRLPLLAALTVVTLTAVCVVLVPFGQTSRSGRPFCPKRESRVISAEGQTLWVWLRRENSSTFVNLCWVGSPTQKVTGWSGAAVDTSHADAQVTFSVLALTAHTALGHAELQPGRIWRVTFRFDSAGKRPSLSTTVRT
ncbi:hypothetical protein [Micromonospora yangpuensis]|uniref:Uncharacterized protein n=1 Tax=Micromonospora yangpuensis TaxID=683228 RepID=A0A1C6UWJ2_9ACTN|nr:hypothetical protein [Micromonospora yangpuensis]GGM25270.1 hypothetical protein GCM10012279_49610 [Micromonospora yangpuensis]SCL58405.1 hypothetical protein GA0070617_3809 [Micromonospora yangpuensis]